MVGWNFYKWLVGMFINGWLECLLIVGWMFLNGWMNVYKYLVGCL